MQNSNFVMKKFNQLNFSLVLMMLIIIGCSPNLEEQKEKYAYITGYWKEYIIKDGAKEGTALRKFEVNSKGKLVQSITVELGSQCRIWLNDDDVTFKEGHLSFWDEELYGDISEDKQSIPLIYRQMDEPFLLKRIHDPVTTQMIDSLENYMGIEYHYSIPLQLNDGLLCASLEEVNINQEELIDLIKDIQAGDNEI